MPDRTAFMSPEESQDTFDFLRSNYFSTLATQKNLAYQGSHVPTQWAYALVGVLLALVFRPGGQVQSIWSFIILNFVLVILSHLGTMVAKSYVNQIRWNLLEKKFLRWKLRVASDAISDEQLIDAVHRYHRRWASPVPYWKAIAKLVFELGFFPLIVSAVILITYMFTAVVDAACETKLLILAVSGLMILIDYVLLRYRSAYFREVLEDGDIKL